MNHRSDCDVNSNTIHDDRDCSCGETLSHSNQIVLDCQKILTEYLVPDGIDANQTLNRLLEILDGPRGLAVFKMCNQ